MWKCSVVASGVQCVMIFGRTRKLWWRVGNLGTRQPWKPPREWEGGGGEERVVSGVSVCIMCEVCVSCVWFMFMYSYVCELCVCVCVLSVLLCVVCVLAKYVLLTFKNGVVITLVCQMHIQKLASVYTDRVALHMNMFTFLIDLCINEVKIV